jgi:hypothetical protein
LNILLGDVDDRAVEFVIDTSGTGSVTGNYYDTHRRSASGADDLLFKINPATGAHIPNAFGAGVDYVTIKSDAIGLEDIDDIAFDPETGELYGTSNDSDEDRLILINKETGVVTNIGVMTGGEDMEGLSFWGDLLVGTTGANSSDVDDAFFRSMKARAPLHYLEQALAMMAILKAQRAPQLFHFQLTLCLHPRKVAQSKPYLV